MKKSIITLVLGLIAGVGIGYFIPKHKAAASIDTNDLISESHCSLRREMDKLWIQHLFWTRQFVISEIAGLPDIEVATERLLKNQDEIGNSIIPYYGEAAGIHLGALLREHIVLAGDIFKANLAKKEDVAKELNEKWYQNSAEIAKYLHQLNPTNWDEEYLRNSLYDHLEGATQKLMLRVNGDWSADIENADKSFNGAQEMGKYFADGIINQFPERFKTK